MTAPRPRLIPDIPSAVTRQAAARERAMSIQGTHREHEFNIDVYGPGKVATQLCTFGYAFVAQPSLTAGVALLPGDSVVGSAPTVNATAIDWVRDSSGGLYLAAYVDIVVTGHRDQQMRVSLVFAGTGLTLPLGPSIDDAGWEATP